MSMHKRATYMLANKDHKILFDENPEKYAPQCGGFCAFGASVNALFPANINTWQIRDGKLCVNLNPEIKKMFDKDLKGNIAKLNGNWPGLVKKHAK